jgi:arylformamidase
MPIHDISLSISPSLPTWPGDHCPVQIEPVARIAQGSTANVSRITLGTHTGTHVDPPLHFIDHGQSVDRLDLEVLVGPAWVMDLTGRRSVEVSDLAALLPRGTKRVLMKTDNSHLWARESAFTSDYVGLTPEAASLLVQQGVELVGIDYLSIQRYGDRHPGAHTALLGAGVVIVEGLNLLDVVPGPYQLICLPLRIADGDGAPARVVLID